MEDKKKYLILAFYSFTPIENPQDEVARHQAFFQSRDVKCRIYIAPEGINGQMSALEAHAHEYMEWMKADPRFVNIDFKWDGHSEHVFPKTTVKFRTQLVALDVKPDLALRGEYVPPMQWKQMLENKDDDTMLIDVRNDYESKIGHFEGAVLPDLENFRDFPQFAEALRQQIDPKKTKIMMYCTGGIRCELYSALLKEKGIEQIFQLQGGIINYGHQVGNEHWKGKLFVFDDRLSVPLNDAPHEIISECLHCKSPCDVYYNCANMDCNELFLSCPACSNDHLGCCSKQCQGAERLRPHEPTERPKPFRKWYHYFKSSCS